MSRTNDFLKSFGTDILSGLRERIDEHEDAAIAKAIITERTDAVIKMAKALNECEVEKEEVLRLIQKYYDLRPSEALSVVKLIESEVDE